MSGHQNWFWSLKSHREIEKVEASIFWFDFQHGIGINYGRIEFNPNTRLSELLCSEGSDPSSLSSCFDWSDFGLHNLSYLSDEQENQPLVFYHIYDLLIKVTLPFELSCPGFWFGGASAWYGSQNSVC